MNVTNTVIRFHDFLALPEEMRDSLTGVWMSAAMREESIRMSQRMMSVNFKGGILEHLLIERDGRRESWVVFRPGNEAAKEFPSFVYWGKYWAKGETILCSARDMRWNILCPTDKEIISCFSKEKYMGEWDIQREINKIAKEYGI
jgi:hypothetical protein